MSGREYFVAQQTKTETTHKITMRYQLGVDMIKAHDRVKFGTRIFDIQQILNPEERNIMLVLYCREWITP